MTKTVMVVSVSCLPLMMLAFVKEKINHELVKEDKADFIQDYCNIIGTTTMEFCSRSEKLVSTLNMTK